MKQSERFPKRSGVGVGLLLGVGSVLLAGCHAGGNDTSATDPVMRVTPAQSTAPVAPGKMPGAPGPRTGPGKIGGPGMPGGRQGMMGGPGMPAGRPGGPARRDPFAPANATPANPAPGGPGGAPKKTVVTFPKKKGFDPFFPTWTQPPVPVDPFDLVPSLRVASIGVQAPPEQPVQVREVADRRVSGIMSGDGVFAIIEQNGSSEIVKPGGTTSDGYRVIAINDDSVKLQKREGNVIRTQIVQLSDIQTGGPTQNFGRPGMSGSPGMIGGPGRPGFGGRPGRGGKGGGNGGAD